MSNVKRTKSVESSSELSSQWSSSIDTSHLSIHSTSTTSSYQSRRNYGSRNVAHRTSSGILAPLNRQHMPGITRPPLASRQPSYTNPLSRPPSRNTATPPAIPNTTTSPPQIEPRSQSQQSHNTPQQPSIPPPTAGHERKFSVASTAIADDVRDLYEKAVTAEREGKSNDQLLEEIKQPYYYGIRFKRGPTKTKTLKRVRMGGVEQIEVEVEDWDDIPPYLGFFNGFTLFLLGFLLFPCWWIGALWPRHVTSKYERRWKSINLGMAIFSTLLFIALIVVLVLQYQKDGKAFPTKSDS